VLEVAACRARNSLNAISSLALFLQHATKSIESCRSNKTHDKRIPQDNTAQHKKMKKRLLQVL
jgi:hypothetical protein